MTYNPSYYNYTLNITNTNVTGIYEATTVCKDGANYGANTFYYLITYNGREQANDFTLVAFYITFLIFVGMMMFTLFRIINYFKEWNVNIMDVCYSFCIYLGAITLYYFNDFYGGVYLIDRLCVFFIKVGWISHIFLPIIAYILSITLGDWIRRTKEVKRASQQNG